MNLNRNNRKSIIAFALVIFMLAPMLAALGTVGAVASTGAISAVQTGTTNVNSISIPSSPNPIGTTISIDVRIDNAANVWGYSLATLSWNPAVLNMTSLSQGASTQTSINGQSWLGNNTAYPAKSGTNFIGDDPSLIDNVAGTLNGGFSEALKGSFVNTNSSGILVQLTFIVVGYGNSPITISGMTLYSTSSDAGTAAQCNSASVSVAAPVTAINLWASGTSNPAITVPSNVNPVGTTFNVDMNISSAPNVWSWNVGLTWTPTVLQLTSITEGSFLNSGVTNTTWFLAGNIDNTNGVVEGQIVDALKTYTHPSASSGNLAVLSFTVISFGNASINLVAGSPTLLDSNYPHNTISPVNLNGATYTWAPLSAAGPQAKITVLNSPFGNGIAKTYYNVPISLSAITSVAGHDTVPPGETDPIMTSAWSITLVNGTVLTVANSQQVDLTPAQVGSMTGNITAVLTVTAPDVDGQSAPTYTSTSVATLNIQVLVPYTGGQLDIWTQNGGQGWNMSANSFGPQQQVNITAQVTYNGAPVVNKTVTFNVYLQGQYIDYATGQTDTNGIATASYRLPWQDSNPTSYFGTVNITSSVDVSEKTYNDSCAFYYGYLLELKPVVITNSDGNMSALYGPMFNRYSTTGNTVNANVTVTNSNWSNMTFYIGATIMDANNVPVQKYFMVESINGATSGIAGSTNTATYSITLQIPTWAFVGPATLNVNIYSDLPQNLGLPFSPQQSATLAIEASATH